MPNPPPLLQQLLSLVDEVHRAPTCDLAMGLLAQRALAVTGAGRALVLVRRGGDLRGAAAAGGGMGQDEARTVVVPLLDVTSAAARAVRGRAPVLSDEGDELGGMGGYLAIPLPGTDDDLLGALAVESAGLDDEGRDAATQLAEHAGPALARAAEVERLRTAATRSERERGLLAAIVEALPEPVLITGPANRILLENRRAAALFSAKDDQATDLRRTGELNNLLLTSFLTRTAAGKGTGRELNLVDPSGGKDLVFEVLSTPLPEGLYDEGATVSVLRDVTELKGASTELEHQFRRVRQGEAKARRERDRLNVILENVSDPILVTDPDGSVTLMNREAERLFEASGGPGAAEQVARNHESFAGFVGELGATAESTRSGQLRLADPATGAQFPAEVVSCKILNDGGETTAVVSIIHDLTETAENQRLADELSRVNEGLEGRIRAATAELEERNRKLEWQSREIERAYRLKSEFLASMSHELRTPINALLGYTTLMRDRIYGELTEKQADSLDRMYGASTHLLELVNDILDLARIEAGKMPLHLERVELADVVREISETVEPMVRSRRLAFAVDLEEGLPAMETDRTRVKQILLNLLSNAVKFTHEGEVRIRARTSRGGVEVQVCDTGIGIDAGDLEGIFEDFRQADQSSTREYGGTGLGLSIVKKLLGLLGGTIRVTSELGEGSTFTAWLPLRSRELKGDEMARALKADSVVQRGPEPEA